MTDRERQLLKTLLHDMNGALAAVLANCSFALDELAVDSGSAPHVSDARAALADAVEAGAVVQGFATRIRTLVFERT